MKRFFRFVWISLVVAITLFILYIVIHMIDHIRHVKSTEARFTPYLSNPKAFDTLPKREDEESGVELCGPAKSITVDKRYHDVFHAIVTYQLIVRRERCNTHETWWVTSNNHIPHNVYEEPKEKLPTVNRIGYRIRSMA